MLICLACRRTDGDHALRCSYIADLDDDSLTRQFMRDNAKLFESERLTHPIGGAPKRAPSQTTDEFLRAILAKPTQLAIYEHSMQLAEPDDAFDQRMRELMLEMSRIDAAMVKSKRTLASLAWPEDVS